MSAAAVLDLPRDVLRIIDAFAEDFPESYPNRSGAYATVLWEFKFRLGVHGYGTDFFTEDEIVPHTRMLGNGVIMISPISVLMQGPWSFTYLMNKLFPIDNTIILV